MGKPAPPCVGEGMVVRRIVVRSADVVLVKGIVEAHEGIAQVFAEQGGDLTLAAPEGRAAELEALIEALVEEVGALVVPSRT